MSEELPAFVIHEMALKARYRRLQTDAGEILLRKTRWTNLHEEFDAPRLCHREAASWLVEGEERIALLETNEFDLEPGVTWDELWLAADGLSQRLSEATLLMRQSWEREEPFPEVANYGSLLFLTGGWIAPAHRTRVALRPAFDAALQVMAPGYAIVTLLAQTLGSAEGSNVAELGDSSWRESALMRLYERELGFRPFPVAEPAGYMWRMSEDWPLQAPPAPR